MGIESRHNPNVHLAQGPARVRDAIGKVLEVGDEILALTSKVVMRIASISPMMDPKAPPGAMLVTMVSRVVMVVPRDQGVEDLYFLRHQAEIGDGAIPGAGEQQQEQKPELGGDMTNAGDGEAL